MITKITLTITHKKPISDLLDKVAQRSYNLDGVDDVSATTDAGWLPIESAPKDGTPILGYWTSQTADIGMCYATTMFGPSKEWTDTNDDGHDWRPPTHWMPLPQPPKEQA
jgi:hypothetical protein